MKPFLESFKHHSLKGKSNPTGSGTGSANGATVRSEPFWGNFGCKRGNTWVKQKRERRGEKRNKKEREKEKKGGEAKEKGKKKRCV